MSQEMNKKLTPNSNFKELTEEIKKTQGLEHLFVDEPRNSYNSSNYEMYTKLSHLAKCVNLAFEFEILQEYIDLYIIEHPEVLN